MAKCGLCNRELDTGELDARNCGGDCRKCMREAESCNNCGKHYTECKCKDRGLS